MSGPLKPNGYVDIDELLRLYIAAGIDADILPGAHDRAARLFVNGGYRDGVRGLDQHHTAQTQAMREIDSINYMTFWAPHPVMCNTYPWKDGRLTICSAGPTYTAGRGGPLGSITSGNGQMWSREIGNDGVGETYPNAQQDTIVKATAVEMEFFGVEWPEDPPAWWRAPSHAEWVDANPDTAGRKYDPWGPCRWNNYAMDRWVMDNFRAEARAIREHLYDIDPTYQGGPVDFYPIVNENDVPEPYRSSDTRIWPKVKTTPGQRSRFSVGSKVPADAVGVLATITGAAPDGPGHVSVAAPGEELFVTSSINFNRANDAVANTTFIPVVNRQYDIAATIRTHLVVDIQGYFK